MGKTWLVTGGAGFIGGNFVLRQVLKNNINIINVDKLTYAGNLDTLNSIKDNPNHNFVKADIGNQEFIKNLLDTHKPDAIINFAAESHVDRSIDSPDDFIQTNIVGTFNLLNQTLDYYKKLDNNKKAGFRFLHVSTCLLYTSPSPRD